MTKYLLSVLFFLASATGLRAAALVEGRVYLKNGSVLECTGDDRLQIPRKSGTLKIFRDAFRKTKKRETVRPEEIDSVVCWHTKSPQYVHRFLFARAPGWMRLYFDTPYIKVCVYSRKGYHIDTNGGVGAWQRRGWFSQSRVAFFLQKQGATTFEDIGGVHRRSKGIFRERIARYIDDDPELAERIRRSHTYRDKTVLMLRDYDPTGSHATPNPNN